jgi:hypothetical protein
MHGSNKNAYRILDRKYEGKTSLDVDKMIKLNDSLKVKWEGVD